MRLERVDRDKEMRRKSIAFLGSRVLKQGLWWYVLQEGRRGFLAPVERFATLQKACSFVEGLESTT